MTDFSHTFIPVTSDTANARSFAETVEAGSDDAARNAREDACRFAFGSDKRWLVHAQRLWAAMRDDMRQIIDTARQTRGYADMADLTRAGYCEQAVETYLRATNGPVANDDSGASLEAKP